MANYNMNNVSLFHSFSKVAAADNTALAAAVNKAGHVVTASDVWSNEIPFCGSADSLADIKTKFADNTAFPVGTLGYDLGTSKLYQKGAEDWTEITPAAAGSYVTISYKDKPVLRWYNKAHLTLLTPDNNGAPSNGFSAKYLGPAADGVGAISQFVSSTDKIVNGIVSDGYDVAVYDGTKKLTKGTSTAAADNQWMDSAYAGMILFMCAQTSKNLSMTCFEYVGDKLETSLSDLRQSIKDISDVTLKGVVASVTADENTAQKAGITVDNTVSTTPVIKFTAGSVTAGDTKLVSGAAVAAVTDALSDRITQLEGITHFEVKPVDALPAEADLEANTIYLVKDATSTVGACYEYVAYFDSTQNKVVAEQIGTTTVDLAGYTTDAEHKALSDRVEALDKADGKIATIEGKVSSLETAVTDTLPAAITKAQGDAETTAKGYTDAEIQKLDATVTDDTHGLSITQTDGVLTAASITTATITDGIFASTTGNKTKLVTAADVEAYVAKNAKITVNEKEGVQDITIKSLSVEETYKEDGSVDTLGDVVRIKVSNDETVDGAITVGIRAELEVADWKKWQEENGFVGTSEENKVLLAGVAQNIVNNTIEYHITEIVGPLEDGQKPTIGAAIEQAIKNATLPTETTIADATGEAAAKLVTAAQVKEYVESNAQVTVTVGASKKTSTGFEFAGSTGADIAVAPTMDANGKVTYAATLSKATVGTDGAITNGSLAVSATDAKTIAEAAVSTSLSATGTGTIGGAISGLDGRLTDAEEAIDSLTGTGADSVDGKVTAAKNELQGKIDAINTSLTTGDIHNEIDGVRQTANTAVQSASGDTYVSAAKEAGTTNIKVSANISAIDSKLAETSSAVGGAIKAAADAAAQSLTDAKKYTDDEIDKVEKSISDALTTHGQDIAKVEAAISSLSTSGFERVVVSSLPTTDIKLNAIYLVPMTTAEKELNGYAEYIYVGGTVTEGVVSGGKFEQIGTTKTDLAEYAKTSEVTATIEALDAEETVNGLTVTQVDGKITGITEALITASVPTDTFSVEGNVAYVGSTKHVIAPEKFQTAAQMPATLTSWVADLSNLTNGDNMFKGCTGLTVFVGDLSSLTSGVDMFNGCTLDADSLDILAANLPTVSGGTIDIGASTNATAEVIAEIKGKGWTLKSNGAAL